MKCPFKVGDIIQGKFLWVVVEVTDYSAKYVPYKKQDHIPLTFQVFSNYRKLTKLERAVL